jgi:hypothetical protein
MQKKKYLGGKEWLFSHLTASLLRKEPEGIIG